MNANVLGLHVNTWTEAAKATLLAAVPACVKVLNTSLAPDLLRAWRSQRPDGLLIVRHHFSDDRIADAKIDALLRLVEPIRDLAPVLEVPSNEAYQTGEGLAEYATWTAGAVERIAAAGYRAAVGNFSVGNPPDLAGDWPRFYPALAAARRHGGYLSLHEYWTPGRQLDSWLALRYQRVYDVLPPELHVPVLITECGIDHGIDGPPLAGYRHYGLSPEQYAGQVRRYRDALAADPRVHGATLYCCGQFGDWATFDVAGEGVIETVLREHVEGPARWWPSPFEDREPDGDGDDPVDGHDDHGEHGAVGVVPGDAPAGGDPAPDPPAPPVVPGRLGTGGPRPAPPL